MFGSSRIESFIAHRFEGRRLRAVLVGATVGAVVLAASAGYTVVSGDTLSEIARDNGTSVSELVEANDIADPDLIITGQVLSIPGTTISHVVADGETLGDIAGEYDVSVDDLVEENALTNADLIRIGQKLAVPVAGAEQGGGGVESVVHVVESGDTLAKIAARYGTTIKAILELNDIDEPSVIYVGTEIAVSGSQRSTSDDAPEEDDAPSDDSEDAGAAQPEGTTHTVQTGETLGDIAAQHGVAAAAIAELNGLDDPNRIRVGQQLRIPDGAAPTTESAGPAFLCPVPNASFVDDYGYIKPDGRFHQGIDMMAAFGAPVQAPVSGRVDAVNGTLGGLQFWLHGDDGNLYIGTHLSDFGKTGRVSQGDVIGAIGDSGNAIGGPPHVHFEILVDGSPTNPYPTLRAACG